MEDSAALKSVVQGALLAAGRALTVDELAELFLPQEARGTEELGPYRELREAVRKQVRAALAELRASSSLDAVEVVEVASGFRYQIKPPIAEKVSYLWDAHPQRLTRAMLETLALITYRQPITRGEIENIRGVSVSSQIIKSFLEYGWIRVVGHKNSPGRPQLFGTTKEFLDIFSLKSLDELPPLAELRDVAQLQAQGLLDLPPTEASTPEHELPPPFAIATQGDNSTMTAVRLPAEWEPQHAILLTWPHAHTDWAEQLTATEQVYLEIARQVCLRQDLVVACHDAAVLAQVRTRLAEAGIDSARYRLAIAPCNDTWARDHGPITVFIQENGANRAELLDFRFNAWGNKYAANLDDQITCTLHEAGAFPGLTRRALDFVLEGGGIDSDGQGTVLTTTSCLLAPTRNPGLDRPHIEQKLHEFLGAQRVLWLTNGQLQGDDTDGHIDTLARFADAQTIVYQACDDEQDDLYAVLHAMRDELHTLRTAQGEPYRLLALPWPRAQTNSRGERLPATYANFLIINGAVLMPSYGDPADGAAAAVLQQAFPEREIVPIDCQALIQQFGSLHCVTMQIPALPIP